jgi:hypothetical protein
MAKECRIEFYFKAELLAKLLNDNPGAKGVIVSQEIVRKTQKNGKPYNLVNITARVDGVSKKKSSAKTAKAVAGVEEVDGCPYPPGCTE